MNFVTVVYVIRGNESDSVENGRVLSFFYPRDAMRHGAVIATAPYESVNVLAKRIDGLSWLFGIVSTRR